MNTQDHDPLTYQIIGGAIEVHRALGPGLLESAYEECLAFELKSRGLEIARQVELPVVYKGLRVATGYRMDMVVNNSVVLELKTVKAIEPVHEAQLLTYLKLSGIKTGLLINFYSAVLKDSIIRRVV